MSFNYYLLNLSIKVMNGNIFINNTVNALSELLGYILSCYFISRLGMKSTLVISYSMSFLIMLFLILTDTSN